MRVQGTDGVEGTRLKEGRKGRARLSPVSIVILHLATRILLNSEARDEKVGMRVESSRRAEMSKLHSLFDAKAPRREGRRVMRISSRRGIEVVQK